MESITTVTTETSSSSNSSSSSSSIVIAPISTGNCTGNSILFSGVCFPCTEGLYKKDNIQCVPCVIRCQICSSTTTCAQCFPGFSLNSDRTECNPSSVICNPGFFRSNENCLPCPNGCVLCLSANQCISCESGFTFNPSNQTCTRTIQTSCPDNSTLTPEGQCICDEFSMPFSDGCFRCVGGSFLNSERVCVSCEIENCVKCET